MEPKHRLLDVVEISEEGKKAVILQVRDYGLGRFRYGVGSYAEEDELEGGIYDEDQLRATGSKADPTPFLKIGDFHIRDLVDVSETFPAPEIRGRTGVISGGTPEGDVSVWFEELGEVFDVTPDHLTPTGKRVPPKGKRNATSTLVTSGGDILGSDNYAIIQDIEDIDL